MLKNRLIYLLALLGATVFYGFFYVWFSEFLLVLLLALPLVSLAISLPSMLLMKLEIHGPGAVPRGGTGEARMTTVCPLPQPACRFALEVTNPLSGAFQRHKVRPDTLHMVLTLPTDHCGCVVCRAVRCRVYDYLGLFALPRRWRAESRTLVTPVPESPTQLPGLARLQARRFRPKPGGGFGEVQELRDYRPGDSLRQVHWKLTAKIDRPVIREPQEPERGPVILSLDLNGHPDTIDRAIQRTLYLSRWLLRYEIAHEVRWISGGERQTEPVSELAQLDALAAQLCRSRQTAPGLSARDTVTGASWHYHVSGQTNG